MAKTFSGIVVSTKTPGAVVVEVTRRIPHPKYKKLLKRSKKFKANLNGNSAKEGDTVVISETRPISKEIHFVVSEVKKEDNK